MKNIILLFFLLCLTFSNSYSQLVKNTNFQNSTTVPCPSNPSVNVTGYNEWEFYQTLNDEWDGEKDSNICISVVPNNFLGCKIPLNQIDSSRRLFIVSKFNSSFGSYLYPHSVFNIPLDINKIGGFNIELGLDGNNQPLSYNMAIIEIPDTNYVGVTNRIQKFGLNYVDTSYYGNYTYNTCMAAEKFDQQNLRQIIGGLKFTQVSFNDTLKLNLFGPDFSNFSITYSQIEAYDFYNYETTIGDGFNPTSIIYDKSTYPSQQNIDTAFVIPIPDPGYPVNMTIYNNATSSLIFEPFTQLAGAEVIGMPGVYHTYTLINYGGEICVNFIELIFHNGDRFKHQSGGLHLNAPNSCFRFMNGATLEVASGSELNYGSTNHSGILLLNDSANVSIESGATLNIWNRVMLREEHPEKGPKQFYMSLIDGATFRFMPGSHLTNLYSADNTIKLNVFMKGGILDDSGLPDEEKLLINRIYDLDGNENNPLEIYPNPASDFVQLHCGGETITHINLYDAIGRKIYSVESSDVLKKIELANLPSQIIIAEVQTSNGIYTAKFMKL